MKEDRDKWNMRFEKRPMKRPTPPGFVRSHHSHLVPGSVLDIACGDGAAALFLAEIGFSVTAADISDVALKRLTAFSHSLDLIINTLVCDLDEPEELKQLGRFDNVVITHFKPSATYWPLLESLIKPGGKLLLSTFNTKHHIEKGFSKRFCLVEGELLNVSARLRVEHYASVNRDGNYMDDYLFSRK